MGWKEDRDQRRDELFKQFVSVETLIAELAKDAAIGIDETAAEFMDRHRQADDSDLPPFGSADDSSFVFRPLANAYQHREVLYEMLSDTVGGCGHGERSDHYGWMREDLFPFLHKIGMEMTDVLPAWKPQDAPASEESADNCTIEYPTPDDFDHEKWPERLGIALMAWRSATNSDLTETTPREHMRAWIGKRYPSLSTAEVDRIATVANWDDSPGRPKKVKK